MGIVAGGALLVAGCALGVDWDSLEDHDGGASSTDATTAKSDAAAMQTDGSSPKADATVADSATGSDAAVGDAGTVDSGSPYVAAVLADHPLLYFRFDEPGGEASAKDEVSGKLYPTTGGVEFGAPGLTGVAGDQAATFDGVMGCVHVTDAGFDFPGQTPFSAEAWFGDAEMDPDASFRRIFSDEMNQQDVPMWQGWGVTFDYLGASRTVNGNPNCSNGSGIPTLKSIDGGAHHLVFTYDGTVETLYLDDAVVGMGTECTQQLILDGGLLTIGGTQFPLGPTFRGILDEIAVYGAALSAARVDAHWHAAGH